MPEALTISVSEAGKLLGIARNTAYEAARRGELPTIRICGRLLVPRAALMEMLKTAGRKSNAKPKAAA